MSGKLHQVTSRLKSQNCWARLCPAHRGFIFASHIEHILLNWGNSLDCMVPDSKAFCYRLPTLAGVNTHHPKWKRAIKTIKSLKLLAEMKLPWVSNCLHAGALWDVILGCAERRKTDHVNTQRAEIYKAAWVELQSTVWAWDLILQENQTKARYCLKSIPVDSTSCRKPTTWEDKPAKNSSTNVEV